MGNPSKNTTISIAMATYNGAKYLHSQLESYVEQTRQPDELVVCDDGSTDNTVQILEEFKIKAPFLVRIFKNEMHLGYVKNFEKALSICDGDLVFLSDQDDIWLPQKIKEVEDVFIKDCRIQVVINDQYIADQNAIAGLHTALSNVKRLSLGHSWFVAGCCTSIRRQFLSVIMPIPLDVHGHDSWINNLANELSVRYVLEKPLQIYRRHGENASSSIVSRLGRVSVVDCISEYGLKDAKSGWLNNIGQYERYRQRIDEKYNELYAFGLQVSAEAAKLIFNEKIDKLKKRIKIVSTPHIFRISKVIIFWINGGYHHFAGWKSAVKDLIRP